ncbi:TNKS-like protein [Mya arenaria]|uniref:TNKS-like protein n=1 Tax=Mya arenaria TaxID=6604 RepID=A0ABY7FED6_MYAAR|nr:TNKS-like protein [Mya arenaria]
MTEQLEVAVKAGRIDVVNGFLSTLAENKSEENAALLKSILTTACYDGSSLLHIASKEDQFDIVRALLSTGADPTVKDLDGHFPYQVSVSEKTRHVYRELLLQAASQSKIPQLKQLIESGVGVNFSDAKESANTPLHWAASFADINTVRCLCEHGADVHAVNMAGCSPLHDGVERGNSEIRSKAVEMSLSGPLEVVTEEKLSRLWPQPQSIEQQEGPPLVITGPAFPVMISMATGSGPRLSSFLLDVDAEEELSLSDCSTLLPVRSDQTLQLCGYPLHDLDKHLFAQIPPHIVFNEYGVQATHNYTEVCKPLSTNGLSFIVCPGTAAWTSLAGCPEAAITNVYNAVKCATAEGAIGVIEYCLGNLEDLLNEHVFEAEGGVVGHAIVELGRAETYLLRIGRALVVSGKNPGGQAGCDVVNFGVANLSPTVKTDLANRLLELLDVYETLWKGRYLEPGLKFYLTGFQSVLKQFIPEGDPRAGGDKS